MVRWERFKVSESRPLAREWEIGAGAWRKKGGLHSEERQVPGRSKKSGRKHERVSGRKNSPERSEESRFHCKSGQT